jgi:hypothetical protein
MPDTLGQTLDTVGKTQQEEKARLETEKGKPMVEQMKPDEPVPKGMTSAQALEESRRRQRQARDRAGTASEE